MNITVKLIQSVVAQSFNQPVSIMKDKSQTRMVAWPRMIAMALSVEMTKQNKSEIGRLFNGRIHSTVIHACKTVKDQCDIYQEAATKVNELR